MAVSAMRELERQNLPLSPELHELMGLFSVNNDNAMEALRITLPYASGIEPTYVHAGMTASDLGLRLQQTEIRVLGPEQDIDGFYLGREADEELRGLTEARAAFREQSASAGEHTPANISASDFRRLQSRMLSSAFAFADEARKVINNTSVVLLIEWKGKRLLFVGDAEWDKTFREGKANSSWNVVWQRQKEYLGYHGSINATPWNDKQDGEQTEPARMRDIAGSGRQCLSQGKGRRFDASEEISADSQFGAAGGTREARPECADLRAGAGR
jgi:hypothetical protein